MIRTGIVVIGLWGCYKIWKRDRFGDYPSRIAEYKDIAKLCAGMFFGQFFNFNRLQYNTELYIRRYGYMTQDRLKGTEIREK